MYKFSISGLVVTIFVTRRNGDTFEVLVDLDDWEWLKEFPICVAPHGKTFRAFTRDANGVKWYLHRAILNATEDTEVDHKDGNGLNCKKENLEECTHAGNVQNVLHIYAQSGKRGVYYNKRTGKFQAGAQLNKIKYHLGEFTTIEEATRVVEDFRAKNMPLSKEARERYGS